MHGMALGVIDMSWDEATSVALVVPVVPQVLHGAAGSIQAEIHPTLQIR